jgi:hypothetical protein
MIAFVPLPAALAADNPFSIPAAVSAEVAPEKAKCQAGKCQSGKSKGAAVGAPPEVKSVQPKTNELQQQQELQQISPDTIKSGFCGAGKCGAGKCGESRKSVQPK